MAHSYADLRRMSMEDLLREYDRLAGSTEVGLSFYREEIARRELAEQSQQILTLTAAMRNMTADIGKWTQVVMWLTIIVTALTVINVILH
jgi:hypothetical protein